MNTYLRNTVVVLVGLAVGIGLIMLVQGIGHKMYPPPEGLNSDDTEAIQAYLSSAPLMALLMVPISYFIGGLGAELVTCRWTKGNNTSILIVGLLLLIATIMTLFDFPHPTWMVLVNILATLLPLGTALYLAPRCRDAVD
jgi:hypothetical protein